MLNSDKRERKFKQLIGSRQNMWKISIGARSDEFKHMNIPMWLLLTVKIFGSVFPMGGERS